MKNRNFPIAIAFCIYTILSVIQCWPIITGGLNTTYFGTGGDMLSGLWESWRYSLVWRGKETFLNMGLTDFPFYPSNLGYNIFNYYNFIEGVLAWLVGPIFALNFIAFIGFPLSGFFMYLFVRYVLKRNNFVNSINPAAFVAGLSYMFCTMHFAQLREHTTLGCIYWIPLYFYLFLKYFDTSKKVFGVLAALVFAFTFQETQYYAWYEVILSLLYVISLLFPRFRANREIFISYDLIKKISFLIICVIIFNLNFIIPQVFAMLTHEAVNAYRKPNAYLSVMFAPHLKEYFIPNPFHPFWGEYFQKVIQSQREGSVLVEFPIFVGYTLLLLALIGIYRYFKNVSFFVVVGLIAIILALPPYFEFWGLKIFSPSGIVSSTVPFRSISRYSILLVLSMGVISSFVLAGLKGRLKIVLIPLAAILILFEGISDYKYLFSKLTFPEYTDYLKTLSAETAIVEVPVVHCSNPEFAQYKYNQINHGLKMFNGIRNDRYLLSSILDSEENRFNISEFTELGITIAVYHLPAKPALKNMKYLQLLKDFPNETIYKIIPNTENNSLDLKARLARFESLFK